VNNLIDPLWGRENFKHLLTQPIRLEPNTIEHFYNGGKLRAEFLGEPDPKDDFRSEEWIFSTNRAVTPGKDNLPKKGYSIIKGANGVNYHIDLLLDLYAKELLGEGHVKKFGNKLGVLLKIFNVGEGAQIPIHWHPTPEFAKRYLDSNYGKNEAWIIVSIQDEGKAWVGFKRRLYKNELRKLIETGNVNVVRSYMHEIFLHEGMVLSIPAGLLHSIGSGVCVLEPQEPTDFSIIPEWKRFPIKEEEAHFGLGWDVALDSLDYTVTGWGEMRKRVLPMTHKTLDHLYNSQERILSEELKPYFWADRISVGEYITSIPDDRFHCLTTLDGEGYLVGPFEKAAIQKGRSYFIPATVSRRYAIVNTGHDVLKVIRCFPPE